MKICRIIFLLLATATVLAICGCFSDEYVDPEDQKYSGRSWTDPVDNTQTFPGFSGPGTY
ncbi:MAG: hypothetical protein JXR25_01970 [Pontiellaceae bacterium]|nr:hypothetical protein [Pontiellaceae bacterium]MBN2783566.1 hypothetical protein [Pontiellaceae bacterium]